ncbi:MAG: DUF4301 family protein [Paludibacteraceae bacterium]|nr:DUF4301 family protein [Paludibacteraceae bacterium]
MKETDLKTLEAKGISEEQIQKQLDAFKTGFPYLNIEKAAAIGDGIARYEETEQEKYLKEWEDYLGEGHRVVKFVPASGAASRMFKNLFEYLNQPYELPKNEFEVKFFTELKKFAFYEDLDKACKQNEGKDIEGLTKEGKYKSIVRNLLEEEGLNYGNLPKGLLKFHTYAEGNRTPVEEHMVEGALYAASEGKVNLHFTVSGDHRKLFEQKVREVKEDYTTRYGVRYEVSFSEQKSSTDTIAADLSNEPFRDEKGGLVFRPGGHGALIENLNDIDGDVIFIKNIDNVVPDRYKADTVRYKKLIAGVLVSAQRRTFAALEKLNSGEVTDGDIEEISRLSEETLNNKQAQRLPREEQIAYLKEKLNRPIRVCGMVKNEGEPGGGPYLIVNKDGSISPQILESSQIDTKDERSMTIMKTATHFNPVDLVCGTKNYKGEPFDLLKYVDPETGFISLKSKYGRDLKALELPGLWNGAMSDWNTLFVEVPVSTFNPVKTVNDLLREQHQ